MLALHTMICFCKVLYFVLMKSNVTKSDYCVIMMVVVITAVSNLCVASICWSVLISKSSDII